MSRPYPCPAQKLTTPRVLGLGDDLHVGGVATRATGAAALMNVVDSHAGRDRTLPRFPCESVDIKDATRDLDLAVSRLCDIAGPDETAGLGFSCEVSEKSHSQRVAVHR